MITIQWPQTTSWEVLVPGAKNTSMPLMAASLLFQHVRLTNIPDLKDTRDFIHFLESLGAVCSFRENVLEIDNSNLSNDEIDYEKVGRTRWGIYFLAWLLHRFWSAYFPYPQWDKIGKRPLDEHFEWYEGMGYLVVQTEEWVTIQWEGSQDDIEITPYFRVGATVNLIIAAVARKGQTTIKVGAFEPHIFCLIDMLRKGGAEIRIRFDHSIIINGGKELHADVEHACFSDYLQSGTFAILWALTAENHIDIRNARIQDLDSFRYALHKTGIVTEDKGDDILRVHRAGQLTATKIQTNIFPWFPTDLMPLFAVLMTQCEWMNRIFEIMYEARLSWLVELEKMGAEYAIPNPHEAYIVWKTPLRWAKTSSWDVRAWAALIIAWMIAEGTTTIDNVYWIERGYEHIYDRLADLGCQLTVASTD